MDPVEPVCAWCGRTGVPMAAVKPEGRRGAFAMVDGISIYESICKDCLSEEKHRYPSYAQPD